MNTKRVSRGRMQSRAWAAMRLLRFDMRFEFYNLFNRVQFNQPDNLLADGPLFGYSTTEYTRPNETTGSRQIQLGMKISF